MIAWLLISFFVLLFLGVPIAMSLGLSAIGGILFLGGGSTVTIAQRMFEGMNSFALLAIPLYTFAGFTMSKGGISKRLMDFCYSIVGHIYGGLAHVNVLSSMIFAGISGSAVADTAGVSGMFMPEMIRKGYSKNFTVAVTAISSTIGIIIPPSIPMVVIAGICGISTGKLFLGVHLSLALPQPVRDYLCEERPRLLLCRRLHRAVCRRGCDIVRPQPASLYAE